MQTINIIELDNEDFNTKFLRTFGDQWKCRIFYKLYRGFRRGELIYIRKNVKTGKMKLIYHEVGHIYGKKHRWYLPNIMHPMWIFRWF